MSERPIIYRTLDKNAQIIKDDDEIPYFKQRVQLAFDSARITTIVIKLNKQCNNIDVQLYNFNQKTAEKDHLKVEMKFCLRDGHKQIYNSIVDSDQNFTNMKIFVVSDGVGIYNVQLQGVMNAKLKQTFLDEFIFKSQYMDNDGSHSSFTTSITRNNDPAGRTQKVNYVRLKEQQELEEALEKSKLDEQLKKMNEEKYLFQKSQYEQHKKVKIDDDEQLSLEIIQMNPDEVQQQFMIQDMLNQSVKKSSDLGYNPPDLGYGGQKQQSTDFGYRGQKQKLQIKVRHNNDDQVKLQLMTKYNACDISPNFMQEHYILEQSSGRGKFLKNIMFN